MLCGLQGLWKERREYQQVLSKGQAQDGSKRSKLRVTVERFQFIGSAGGGAGYQGGAPAGESHSDANSPAAARPRLDGQAPAASDDDIPF